MSLIVPTRRGFIAGIVGLIASPAIVRASSLMPVKAFDAFYNSGITAAPEVALYGDYIVSGWILADGSWKQHYARVAAKRFHSVPLTITPFKTIVKVIPLADGP